MTRFLLIAAMLIPLSGCRLFNCNKSSCQAPAMSGAAMPVSYGAPAQSYPASFSMPVGQPIVGLPASYPVIPPPTVQASTNAVELPFPEAVAPVMPHNSTRSVGLPK